MATATPDAGLPSNAPTRRTNYRQGAGESKTEEWSGCAQTCNQVRHTQVASGNVNIAELDFIEREGRCALIARFGRTQGGDDPAVGGDGVVIVEELYAVDVAKDIVNAPIFNKEELNPGVPEAGEWELSDDQKAIVVSAHELGLTEAVTINKWVKEEGHSASYEWEFWTEAMKQLKFHLRHGNETFWDNQFKFRRSKTGVRSASLDINFDNVNRVVGNVDFVTEMSSIVAKLPDGEWLKKTPTVASLGNGKWRGEEEYWWSGKWSKVYGGTWQRPEE